MSNIIRYDNALSKLVIKNAEGLLSPRESNMLSKLVEWKIKEVDNVDFAEPSENIDWE